MRLKNISLMSIFMCFGVIAIHITSYIIDNPEIGSNHYNAGFLINQFFRFAVPCFVFLSGYKLYSKYKNEKINVKDFYLGRLKKIVIPYIICFTIYFLYYYFKGWITLADFSKELITGGIAAHFYYIIFSIQLYLLFPFILWLFEKHPNIALAISLIITAITNVMIHFEYDHIIFSFWLLYFVFGMYVSKYEKEKINKKSFVFYTIGFAIFSALAIYSKYLTDVLKMDFSYYLPIFIIWSIFSMVFWLNLFKMVSNGEHKIQDKIISFFEPNTYYIYLYHVLFIAIAKYDIFNKQELTQKQVFWAQFGFTVLLVLIMCFGLNLGRKMIKKASKN